MQVVVFSGYSGSGKTTVVERLIPAMKALNDAEALIAWLVENQDRFEYKAENYL
jgi:molybdopterin-guanine dinucleotide biosynthesis protein